MKAIFFILICLAFQPVLKAGEKDSLEFKGQLSAYSHINSRNKLPWWNGARYIPQLNYTHRFSGENAFDMEASLNIYGNAAMHPFDSSDFDGVIKPYRAWARYSSSQFEIRAGLQKINFGSASILRPLMWFDRIDPRDPLKLTDGVWGVLGRYYFLNNANIWLWGLLGNEKPKGWESFGTRKNIPEFGGRIQLPVPKGEAGFSYHHRTADMSIFQDPTLSDHIPENRFGFDAKFDMVAGWWFEASWSKFANMTAMPDNTEILNAGVDYTFGLGNGLTVIFEQLLASNDSKPFAFSRNTNFSLLSLSYPVNIFDSINAIIYYDWKNNKAYNFLTWQKQFNMISLYLMGYINPAEYHIPAQTTGNMSFAGTGLQVMLVFNH